MTEEEAKKKWCHRTLTGSLNEHEKFCLGSDCMAWRVYDIPNEWENSKTRSGYVTPVKGGFCGLAGKP
jgi:hypothetical protein